MNQNTTNQAEKLHIHISSEQDLKSYLGFQVEIGHEGRNGIH